jgi:hypothetical protein
VRSVRWIALGPLAFLVHDAEELLTFGPWLRRHEESLPGIVRTLFGGVSIPQFGAAVAVLLLGYVAASALGVRSVHRGERPWPYLVVTGAFVGNAVTHVLQSAMFRGYTPGVATAVLVSLPYGWMAARAIAAESVATRSTLGWTAAAGIVIQVPLALLALLAGRQLGGV